MSDRITQEELNAYLWNAAVLLRAHIDAGAYKQYIFPLLFFKRMCDVYDEECVTILDEYEDEDAIYWEENHQFIIPDGAHWTDVRNTTENIGKTLVEAFHHIEAHNRDKLTGIFGDAAWTNKKRLPDSLLKDLLEHFSSKILSLANCPEDELGQGYEYLIKKFADDSGHTAQEFYTNRTVVHLMTEILKPKLGESVYDPTCGSAGMLISCIAYLKKHGLEWRNVSLYGQEINQLSSAIGRMNLFLHGIEDFEIANSDTLAHPAFLDAGRLRTFDMVLANPPYSISQWNRDAFSNDPFGRNIWGTPPQSRADYAFIQHIAKSLDSKTGRAAILLPHGILFRAEERAIREKMIRSGIVEAVVGLGANLFFNSPMEACVLILRTQKSKRRAGRVLLIDASAEVTRRNAQSFLEDAHIEKIADAYSSNEPIEGFSAYATIDEVAQKDFSLSIPLYVRSEANVVAGDEVPTVAEAVATWEAARAERAEAFTAVREYLHKNGGDPRE